MKKIFSCLIIIICIVLTYIALEKKKPKTVYLQPGDKIVKSEKPLNKEVEDCISVINQRNDSIKSMLVSDMSIKLQQKTGPTVRTSGFLAIEKEKNFRLIVTHFLTGKEIDIGSNSNYFWFWSKRMKPPALHYAEHKDLDKTMLKTVFNPNWMFESLNINKIEEKYEIGYIKNYYALTLERKNIYDEAVHVLILIDPIDKVIVGRYLYQDNNLLASSEYHNFDNGIARKITVNWYEESIYMEWNLSNLKINERINPATWKAPDMKNVINMAE